MAENEDNTLSVFPNTPEHIRRKLVKRGECWEWTGRKDKDGYGGAWFDKKSIRAHRLIYSLEVGAIPSGVWVLHHCDNPPCCNPSHLFSGNARDNVADMIAKQRNAYGERSGKSTLTSDSVRLIRQLDKSGVVQKEISRIVGCSEPAVSHVILGRVWRHLDGHEIRKSKIKQTRLSDKQVAEIRQHLKDGATQTSLAVMYGASRQNISVIANGKSHKHVLL